jgi:Mn2+/Fe2+ NRAMP family transporter
LSAGFVTGAADDDPSGVATYSQVGAKFGYALLWVVFLTIPLMIAIQMELPGFCGQVVVSTQSAEGCGYGSRQAGK